MPSLRRYAWFQVAALLVSALAVRVLAPGPARVGGGIGVAAAVVSTAAVWPLLMPALTDSVQRALAVMVGTFLARMVVVGAGLLVCHRAGGDLLACAAGFFLPYLVCQTLEVAFVAARARPAVAQGSA